MITIEATNVTKTYGSGNVAVHALRGVDFHAREGEFVMLNGPSGSGKTTLLSILGCVLTPSGGEVQLYGESLARKREKDLPRLRLSYIGFIFQGHNLVASLDCRDNVALPMRMRGWSVREANREAEHLLRRVGLGDKTDRLPSELSGGQRQRVAIARAVAGAPPIILADEPTASLDAETGMHITQLLKQMANEGGHTVVVVTHDNRIFHLADRIVNIEDGRISEGH
ncbi:ABC transporter ATP-binding protein [Sandaracinus amylolyticus]|uniref:ABC transporter ATP-binding protein n=1 Tax=Sandaracinus amylolyticus TaxID=927083 RepID=UPI001F26C991|nr:ABC transporter ATP-binding protein [Sandaracinus amylolyticus]UJR79537.1 ABC-type antimicrobial peptide transport system, ATPase component [Sandaracinus amylolyticus]